MARPKSAAPTKGRLNITISEQTRLELTYISHIRQKSISEVVSDFAKSESNKLSKKTGISMPITQQIAFTGQ